MFSTQILNTDTLSSFFQSHIRTFFQLLLGSSFLIICSKITIPLSPVLITMQTFGIACLAMFLGGERATYSILFYLIGGCLELPVFATPLSNPFWWMLPSAGYLVAFPIAAFVMGKMCDRYQTPSPFWIFFSLVTGHCVIYLLGILGLMRFMSLHHSLMVGLFPFLLGDSIKIFFAMTVRKLWLH